LHRPLAPSTHSSNIYFTVDCLNKHGRERKIRRSFCLTLLFSLRIFPSRLCLRRFHSHPPLKVSSYFQIERTRRCGTLLRLPRRSRECAKKGNEYTSEVDHAEESLHRLLALHIYSKHSPTSTHSARSAHTLLFLCTFSFFASDAKGAKTGREMIKKGRSA
jgi:hypothetical protein